MALTPEDVVNKRFQPTKFREGYDQDEVDDFLDEVVVELRRLGQDNEELRQRVLAKDSQILELQHGGGSEFAQSAPVSAAPFSAVPVAPLPVPVALEANAGDPDEITANTNNLLQLARKLHEEHVREGIEKRDALIAEGKATAVRVVSEAEEAQRSTINALDKERNSLESRVEELRSFEREYRQKLKSYIEGQLRELDSNDTDSHGRSGGSNSQSAALNPSPPSYQGFGGS